MRRALLVCVGLALLAPSAAYPCSRDDATFYETFLDTTCLQLPLTNTTLDALGGLRLTTNGVPTATAWDNDAHFGTGISHEGTTFGPVGVRTLSTSGTGPGATLQLPTTLLPLVLDSGNPILRPATASLAENDNVDDPTLAKVGSTYVMWYSGTSEDGGAPAILMATSTDGVTWSRANGGNPVLRGTAGAFDEDGVYGADVVYDPVDPVTPYRMWYSGKADMFGGIGYATSVDGVTWLKWLGPAGLLPTPVLDHGAAGSADSFSAADPSVLRDGSTWKMWYTGDDSSKKRVAYATSTDGITWSKGGKVIAPEDPGVSANIAFGAFAPTVWKTAAGYSMLLTGRKIVSGSTFQTKIMSTSSADGFAWAGPSPALNPSGSNSNFDYSNLNSPELLQDPGTASPFKLHYSGNTIDANGNFHTRIGLATSTNGTSFGKVNGAQTGGSVLDIGALGTAFDARQASGLSVAAPAGASPKFSGFYWGARGSDFLPRLGEATSSDGSAWTKVPVGGGSGGPGGALFPDAVGNAFDRGGRRDPSVLYDSGTYGLYYTGLSNDGTRTIGFASTSEVGATKQPDNASWSARSQVLDTGSGWDAGGVGHPSALKDGSTYVLYYTGTDSGGVPKMGRATASALGGTFTRDAGNPLLSLGTVGSFDEKGVKDPVVAKLGAGDYRLLYTGVDADGIERVGYATSGDGVSWTKQGPVLNPSRLSFAYDESGVEAAGMLRDGSTLHVWTSGDRSMRTRGGHSTTPYPTPASAVPGIPSGWATYQLGDASKTVRDFRQIARTSSGANISLWMSFLQPYSSGGNEFWSDYFPISAPTQSLNFLLTVRGVRWQARVSDPAGSPALDKVELTHAAVSFSSAGSATSATIGPSAGRIVTAWKSLTANASLFTPGGSGTGSATATLVNAATGQPVSSSALNTGGDTTLDLTGVPAATNQALQLRLDLQSSGGQATPRVNSVKVVYESAPAPPPVPPTLALVFAAAPRTIVFGQSVRLSGMLKQNDAPFAAQAVALAKKPLGATAFVAMPSAPTDAAGAFRASAKPTKKTTYKASFAGAPDGLVTVSVKHLVTLTAVRRGARITLSGRIGPIHSRRLVVIQVRKGTRWVSFARVRTTRRGTFRVVRTTLRPRTRYSFRARTGTDREHLAGLSRIVRR
jgi:predicted GH43/DUF377 family glycosyl hydrolase